MKKILSTIRYGWDAARWIRLTLGLVILLPAAFHADLFGVAAGLVFTMLPLLGYSCCGSGSCEIHHSLREQKSFVDATERKNFDNK